MRTVLAALDTSAAAQPVLDIARGIADVAHAEVRALQSPEDGEPVDGAVLHALAEPDVVIGVLSAQTAALEILEQTGTPIVVVPPSADGARPFARLLVPLEGDEQSSRPVAEDLRELIQGDVELVVVHVFTAATAPTVLDHPTRDMPILGAEFGARFCPDAVHVDLRTGTVGEQVRAAAQEADADLIVLSWSQDASPGHAAVIRDVLGLAAIPVLLLLNHAGVA